MCVYLDLTHIDRSELDRKLGGILEIYEKFQGVDPREVPMKIFPAVHYSMGGLWVDYEKTRRRRTAARIATQSDDQHSGPVRDRRVRLSVPRCQSLGCQFAAELHLQRAVRRTGHRDTYLKRYKGGQRRSQPASLFTGRGRQHERHHEVAATHRRRRKSLPDSSGAGRRDDQGRDGGAPQHATCEEAYVKVSELQQRAENCSLTDTGNWTNQNVVFTKALQDMFPSPKRFCKAPCNATNAAEPTSSPNSPRQGIEADDPADRRQQAEQWCDGLKPTTASGSSRRSPLGRTDEPSLTYEDVDTSADSARPDCTAWSVPRVIEEVWKEREAKRHHDGAPSTGNGCRQQRAEAAKEIGNPRLTSPSVVSWIGAEGE